MQELINADQAEDGYDADLGTQHQQQVTNNGLIGSQLTGDVTEKPEVECDAIDNEVASGNRLSTTDVTEVAETSTDSEIMSSDMKVRKSSCNDETVGEMVNAEGDQIQAVVQSALSDQSVAAVKTTSEQVVEQSPQMTETFCAKPKEEELQEQRLSTSSGESQVVRSCQDGEEACQIPTCSESLRDFNAAASDSESSGTAFLSNQQPETPLLNELITSPKAEMVLNSDGVLALPEQSSTLSTPEAENKQFGTGTIDQVDSQPDVLSSLLDQSTQKTPAAQTSQKLPSVDESFDANKTSEDRPVCTEKPVQYEMRGQVDSQTEVQSSFSNQSTHDQEIPAAQTSEQLSSVDGSSSAGEALEDRPVAVEQPVQTQLDEISATSEPLNDVVEVSASTSINNVLDSSSEEMGASTAAKNAACADEEDQFRPDSASSDQPESSIIPLFGQELRSSGLSRRSGTEAEIRSTSATSIDRRTFTFPEPPHHPYELVRVGDDDDADDVFAGHSPAQNDTMASEEQRQPAMTSSTTTAAAEASDASRQQRVLDDELFSADDTPVSLQPRREDEDISDQLPKLCGQSYGAQVRPTSAATAATAPAEDGDRLAEKSYSAIRADNLDLNELKKTSEEACTSSGDLLTATQQTDEVHQQLDEVLQQESNKQQSSGSADRRQLSLLIPGHDSDPYSGDNQQVSVYTQSSKFIRAQISVLRNFSSLLVFLYMAAGIFSAFRWQQK